jgi:hypothetical protein
VRAPNLPARIAIARKGSRTRRRENRRVNGASRQRISEKQAVRIEDEPANIGFLQDGFEALCVSALGQPKSVWLAVEKIDINIAANQDLSALRFMRMQR